MKKRQKTGVVAESDELEKVEQDREIIKAEEEFLEDQVTNEVRDSVDNLFQFAIERYNRRVKPPANRFSEPLALKDYQQQGLGWLLDREGYIDPGQKIIPDWILVSGERGEWVNAQTGVTVNLDARPVAGTTGDLRRGKKVGAENVVNSVYGGILADEMGLGKTIQMISLISTHYVINRQSLGRNETKATLVIVPPILIGNWEAELAKWAPRLRVYVHYGIPPTERVKDARPLYDNDVVLSTYQTVTKDIDFIKEVRWWRVILDEGHKIKNAGTDIARAMHVINARNRWIMSGTPIQNRWRDLYSLLKFLHVRPYGEFQGWYRLIEQPLAKPGTLALGGAGTVDKYKEAAGRRLRDLIQSLVMRRTKLSKAGASIETGGVPLLNPGLVIKLTQEIKNVIRDRAYENTAWEVERRRQYAEAVQRIAFWEVIDTEFLTFKVKAMDPNLRSPISFTIPYMRDGIPTFEFIRELVHIPDKTIDIVRLNFTPREQDLYRNLVEKERNNMNSLVFLLRLRQAAIHPWLLLTADEQAKKIGKISNASKTQVESESADARKRRIESFWQKSSKITYITNDVDDTKPGNLRDNEKSLIFSQFTRALDLLEIELQLKGWVSQKKFLENTQKYRNSPRYVRIDGKTQRAQRERAMRDLRDDQNVKLALLSLHATGVGLNLVSANNVYFLDLFFNPQIHAQAIDRTHRIGQTREVKVKMVVIKDTIEDSLLNLLGDKQKVFDYTLAPKQITTDQILKLV